MKCPQCPNEKEHGWQAVCQSCHDKDIKKVMFPVKAKWATTGRCEKHNTFFSVPDSRCLQCDQSFDTTKNYPSPEELHAAETCEDELETSAKPYRYNQTGTEYWDAVKGLGWDYMQGTAGKYIHRYKDKNGPEDLVKAINYCIKMLSQETGIDYYELHKLTPEELAKRVKK